MLRLRKGEARMTKILGMGWNLTGKRRRRKRGVDAVRGSMAITFRKRGGKKKYRPEKNLEKNHKDDNSLG